MDDVAGMIKKLTRAQRSAFERIAIGLDRGVHPKSAAVLLRQGLIEAEEETLPSWPTPVTITRYFVPLPVHMDWCRLCSNDAKSGKRKAKESVND